MTPSEILNKVADDFENGKVRWYPGEPLPKDKSMHRSCTMLAIDDNSMAYLGRDAAFMLLRQVGIEPKEESFRSQVYNWNDSQTDKRAVISALRAAANT